MVGERITVAQNGNTIWIQGSTLANKVRGAHFNQVLAFLGLVLTP